MPEKISILIPAYNVAPFIERAIQSVLAQTFSDWNLLVIDDCSTDDTFKIAKQYSAEGKVKVLRNDVNLGMLANWNKGIALCSAPFFVKLDADDFWHPDMLNEAMQVLESNPGVGLVFSKFVNVDNDSNVIPESLTALPAFACEKPFSCIPLVKLGANSMLGYPILRQGLSVMRRNIFEEIGYYRYLMTRETQSSTDTEFYFRLGCHYDIYCIDKVLYFYRIHSGSVSTIDQSNGLYERKLFETKSIINDYYFEKKKISRVEWLRNKGDIGFAYKRNLLYRYRSQKRFGKFLSNLILALLLYPFKTVSFYSGRIFNRFAK